MIKAKIISKNELYRIACRSKIAPQTHQDAPQTTHSANSILRHRKDKNSHKKLKKSKK